MIGKVAHDLNKLLKVLSKIGTVEQLYIVYEAGPTGFGLQRALTERSYVWEIIAPSQIPRRPGDRVKTDGRDSIQLAECSRAGQLSAVWIPDPGDEAIRDLARAREDAVAVSNYGPSNDRSIASHLFREGFTIRGVGRGLGLWLMSSIGPHHGIALQILSVDPVSFGLRVEDHDGN